MVGGEAARGSASRSLRRSQVAFSDPFPERAAGKIVHLEVFKRFNPKRKSQRRETRAIFLPATKEPSSL